MDRAGRATALWGFSLSDNLTTRLYFECHITIEPVDDGADRDVLKDLAHAHGFRVAELLMAKRREDTPERSKYDTFLTGRGVLVMELKNRAQALVQDLHANGFTVWRTKIEETLLDTDYGDSL